MRKTILFAFAIKNTGLSDFFYDNNVFEKYGCW